MQVPLMAWPNGKRIAVAVSVMFETWSDGAAPSYSVQTTHLKGGTVDHAGHAWSTYGGREGVWRIIRTLDRRQVPATFFTNARCAEIYPDAVRQIVRSGHDVAGHAYTQDKLLTYMTPDEERATIFRSLEVLAEATGKPPTGWLSPVVAFTPHTAGFLAEAGLTWHNDVTYVDMPHRIHTEHGVIAGVPKSDFTDNRVLKSSSRGLYEVYTSTFDYLYRHEPMSMLVLTLHCHFGGRPMVTAVFDQIVEYIAGHPDVWFCRLEELGDWALAQTQDEHPYRGRYFRP
ncbi:Peptidoglycan deacetylase [Pigmentiphaga humi]|uniref:Peptidoglycan deacetylase n=1 Tax=Pigmentiphaga humi TaxID=2478468 RepID=A0A3P4B7B5_9BURK|nr:polysaccharide deacetylase family protein [Pigmentiphaga humi]VCU71952.1 Peptidoglycan deacetylase [Pigmentiphaga humi]